MAKRCRFFIWLLVNLPLLEGQTLPEGSPDRTTVCAGTPLRGSCPSGEVIIVKDVQYGTKETASSCDYDAGDCLLQYDATAQQAACSGKAVCGDITVAQADTSSCGAPYPDPGLNDYLTMEYYCVLDSRVALFTSASLEKTGSALYLKNTDYPNPIRATETAVTCSVETTSCTSQIKIHFVHFELYNGGSCPGTQTLQVVDKGGTQTYSCSDNTGYTISLKMTSTSNYLVITLNNPDGTNDGKILIGFEGTENTTPVKLACPKVDQSVCMDCQALATPSDGSLSRSSVVTGTTVTVSCDPGFTLDGAATLECQTDGTWTASVGLCRPDCPALTAPTNGNVSPTTTVSFGHTATYSCDGGYSLIGVSTRMCQTDGSWSDSKPICGCQQLSSPANGMISVTVYTVGGMATYSCSTGYKLNGDATRTCQANDTWSGSEPTCAARELDGSCSAAADCSAVISGSTCDSNVCKCIDGYKEENKKCVKNEDSGGLSPGELAGIIVTCIVVVTVAVVISFIVYKKYNSNKRSSQEHLRYTNRVSPENTRHSILKKEDNTEFRTETPPVGTRLNEF